MTFKSEIKQSLSRWAGLGLFFFVINAVRADEFDDLRIKWKTIIVGANYNTNDPDIAAEIQSIGNTAAGYSATINTASNRTYLWSDLASTNDSGQISTAYGRLRAMALAYSTPGCQYAGNPTMLAKAIGGLDWMNVNRYNASSTQYGNWFDWEIGVPLHLTDICVLLYDQLPPIQVSNYMSAVDHQTPIPDMTGANLIWKAHAVGVRGCVVKDPAKIVLARDALSLVFPYVTSGDGFYADGGFIQHGRHPYTAGYGRSLISNLAPLLNWLDCSPWAVTDPSVSHVYDWINSSYQPIIYRGAAWDLVRGREASRPSGTPQSAGHDIMCSILQIAQFAPAGESARMLSMVKYWAQSDTARKFIGDCSLPLITSAKNLLTHNSVVARGELIGNFQFPSMDRVIHLRPGFGLGLSMCSSRIYNFESINGENLHGWLTGDGMTTIYNADLDQFSDGWWPTMDPYRLPGVTSDPTQNRPPVLYASDTPSSAYGASALSPHSWVGGATLGEFGSAGMQFKSVGSTLTAKKSWFMFDNEVVCLGAAINSSDNRPIEQTVENRRLGSAGDNMFIVNGTPKSSGLGWNESLTNINWAHLAGTTSGADIGYFFPTETTIRGLRQAQTGAWSDVQGNGSTTPITRNYLRMTIEYGSDVTNGNYSYVLLPGFSPQRVTNYAAAPQIRVITNTGNVQAVSETTLGLTAANFWTDTSQTAGEITANKQSCVLVRKNGPFIDVSVSDPTQTNTGIISVQVAMDGRQLVSADPGITVIQSSPTISIAAKVNGARGTTLKARFFTGATQGLNLTPEADAYVRDGLYADTNYGKANVLIIKMAVTNLNRASFLRFNIPANPGGVPVAAHLQLMPGAIGTPGVHGIAKVDYNSWLESGSGGVTWNTQPEAVGTTLASWTPTFNTPVTVDVSSVVTNLGACTLKVFPLTQTSDGYVEYGSREQVLATNRPQLILLYGHTPPEVTLVSPDDGTMYTNPMSINLTAQAQATDGAITNVAIWDGTTLLSAGTNATLAAIATFAPGAHFLTAVATDANGLSRTSLVSRIDVVSPPPPPIPKLRFDFDDYTNATFTLDGSPNPTNGFFSGTATRTTSGTTPSGNGYALNVVGSNGGIQNWLAVSNCAKLNPTIGFLTNITIAFWMNLQGEPSVSDRILSKEIVGPPALGFGVQIYGPGAGNPAATNFALSFGANNVGGIAKTTSYLNASNKWVFCAVTYDGTKPSGTTGYTNVYWYSGTPSSAVAQLGNPYVANYGFITNTAVPLRIGSTPASGNDRTPPAWIDDVQIFDTVLTPAQIEAVRQANSLQVSSNTSPMFALIQDQILSPGQTLVLTNLATDPQSPPQLLSFTIQSAPTNATINPITGIFSWRAPLSAANTTNLIRLQVADNGIPSLAATQQFSIYVLPLSRPSLTASLNLESGFSLTASGVSGPDYTVQVSSNLSDWINLYSTNSSLLPFVWRDAAPPTEVNRFYRLQLGP